MRQVKIILVDENNLTAVQRSSQASVMALGFFDGVHKGHQQVIAQAKEAANQKGLPLAIMSFFPHPKTVFSNVEMDYLMPMEQKAQELKKLGADIFYIVDFTKTFASLSPAVFIKEYVVNLQVVHAVAGFDYTYGSKGAGTIHTIEEHSEHQVTVEVAEEYALYGSKVSSTSLRGLLKEGQIETITALLGRAYKVEYHLLLGVKAYYTLPKPGQYYVTAIHKNRAISQTIDIKEDGKISFHRDMHFDECSIVFHHNVEQSSLQISS